MITCIISYLEGTVSNTIVILVMQHYTLMLINYSLKKCINSGSERNTTTIISDMLSLIIGFF